jgi:hypothetical protein
MPVLTSEHLLHGPRGRRLCWELVDQLTFDRTGRYELFPMRLSAPGGAVPLKEMVAFCNEKLAIAMAYPLEERIDGHLLLALLRSVVGSARYWQPPDEVDQWLMECEVAKVLRPVATAIASHPLTRWWASDIARDSQHCIVPTLAKSIAYDPARALSDWVASIRSETTRWTGPHASGVWWTGPVSPLIAQTTRAHPGWGIVGLSLIEDAPGLRDLATAPSSIKRDVRVFEVHTTNDWRTLVKLAPLDVTRARGNDWSATTGLDRQWLVPHWEKIAEKIDGIHLSLGGYLALAGVPIEMEPGVTSLIAGWNPDTTYWITDVIAHDGAIVDWHWEGAFHPGHLFGTWIRNRSS